MRLIGELRSRLSANQLHRISLLTTIASTSECRPQVPPGGSSSSLVNWFIVASMLTCDFWSSGQHFQPSAHVERSSVQALRTPLYDLAAVSPAATNRTSSPHKCGLFRQSTSSRQTGALHWASGRYSELVARCVLAALVEMAMVQHTHAPGAFRS